MWTREKQKVLLVCTGLRLCAQNQKIIHVHLKGNDTNEAVIINSWLIIITLSYDFGSLSLLSMIILAPVTFLRGKLNHL